MRRRELLLSLDPAGQPSLGRQLQAQLRDAVRSGRLRPGQPLPSSRALAADAGVSRGVVMRAYAQLAAEGYLVVQHGATVRVRDLPATPITSRQREPRLRYDLRPERPDLSSFPRQAWLASMRHALATAADADLGYVDHTGMRALREELAGYLGRVRGVVVSADNVVITAGTTHALALLARVFRRRGERTIAVENPSHAFFHTVVRQAGLAPHGIPLDGHGLVVGDLERSSARVAVVSPAHQFPTGVVLSDERRAALLDWALACEGFVIEDDYDAEFRFDRPAGAAVQGLAPGRVIYLGTTSKTLAPALRLGWAVLPPALATAFASEILWSTIHLPTIEQLAFADFLQRGELDRHLHRMRCLYRRRRELTVQAVRRELPWASIGGIDAGLHVTVALADRCSEEAAVRAAAESGIGIGSVGEHTLPGLDVSPGLLVGFASLPEPAIPDAITALSAAIARSA